ncbi:MAG: hypothetical protein AAB470_01650 [Patescibacteria group bacterium]
MKTFSSLKQNKLTFSLSIIVAVFFVVSVASAVTTISTAISTAGNITTTAGNIEATAGTLTVGGASSLAAVTTSGTLTVGSSGTAVNSMVFGYCNIANSAAITASTSAYFNCTGATGLTNAYRVFVQATSSMPAGLHVEAASTTADATINLRIYNADASAATRAPGAISLNFFGIR